MEKMEEATPGQREVTITNTLNQRSSKRRGGLVTIPFILGNETFERLSGYGLVPNMIFYMMRDYRIGVTKGASIIFLWSAASNFMPIFGALISDSFLGRYLTIGLASISSLLGQILLWSTAMIQQTRPPPCNVATQSCEAPTAGQMTMLLSSMALISIGAGGVRPCSLAFGADQLDNRANPKNERVLESFFGWYYASTSFAVMVALTAVVYIQERHGWKVGFGVPAILMLLAVLLFFIATPLYVRRKASKSLLTGLLQVIVVAFKNRNVPFPVNNSDGKYFCGKNSEFIAPTVNLRFLNKACIIRNAEQDLGPDGSAANPWNLCTIEQVEELKALMRITPMWSTGIVMSISTAQGPFQLLQANSMDRHLTSKFQIPAGSFPVFLVITMGLWIVFYDRALLPLASKIKGKPVKVSVKLRMGLGLFISCLAMTIGGIVENIRRRKAIDEGYLNNANAVVKMSALWLAPQFCLNGLAEALNAVGQTEFYYTELPRSMSSIAGALFGVGMGVANLLATVILNAVHEITAEGGKGGWVQNNINMGHYDNYYWLLAIMGSVNLVYFLLCCWAYGPCKKQITRVRDAGNGFKNQEEMSILQTMNKD